jgi:hypothetical protein
MPHTVESAASGSEYAALIIEGAMIIGLHRQDTSGKASDISISLSRLVLCSNNFMEKSKDERQQFTQH